MNRIKIARVERKLTQHTLAELCGVTVRQVQNWEAGRARPGNIDMWDKLSKALNTTIIWLMGTDVYHVQAGKEDNA